MSTAKNGLNLTVHVVYGNLITLFVFLKKKKKNSPCIIENMLMYTRCNDNVL